MEIFKKSLKFQSANITGFTVISHGVACLFLTHAEEIVR